MNEETAASEGECDTALRLNSGNAEVLALGVVLRAQRGAEFADHAILLNPNYQRWQAWNLSTAYFMSVDSNTHCASWNGSRTTTTTSDPRSIAPRAMRRSAGWWKLERPCPAPLQHLPDLTIEGFTGTADNNDADRIQFIGPMRAAGSRRARSSRLW
jgi:hypothetical protein